MQIVITGATKGIGRAIADFFAEQSFDVAVCARTQSDLVAMREDYAQRFPKVRLITATADFTKPAEVRDFGTLVLKQCGPIDILVNNAGIFLPGTIQEEEEGALAKMMQVNLYSAYDLTRQLLPRMVNAGRGHIFNICSVASLGPYTPGSSYSISKFALMGFSQNLLNELKDKGIRVTAISPGPTWSASWDGVDLPKERLSQARDVAISLWGAWSTSPSTVVEDIVLRPQLGDL